MVCVLRVETITDDDTTSQILQSFWQLEAMGITDSGEPPSTECIACFRGTIRKKNDRYTVALPWKEDHKQLLGSNRDTALTCLQKQAERLSMNEALLERYDEVIRRYLELGHAEVAPKNVLIDRATYYMPHWEVKERNR